MSFEYLGVNITSNKKLTKKVWTLTIVAARVSEYLTKQYWKHNANLQDVCKINTETWAETAATTQLLRTTEIRTLRSNTKETLRNIHSEKHGYQSPMWNPRHCKMVQNKKTNMETKRLTQNCKIGETTNPSGRPSRRWFENWILESQLRLQLWKNMTWS